MNSREKDATCAVHTPRESSRNCGGFTLLELLVVAGTLVFLVLLLAPALARTRPVNRTFRCANNLRHLTVACRQWTEENNDLLLAAESGLGMTRPNWVTGNLDFNGSVRSNWDINQDIVKSPLWPYLVNEAGAFKCPSDLSTVLRSGVRLPRVRSYSMSAVFGTGAWLDRNFNPVQPIWRTYAKMGEIVLPSKTFLFIQEHPDSINDGAFASVCTGAQPLDPPGNARIIDYPAALHEGACNLSFMDGHVETHRWAGAQIRNAPVLYSGTLALNVPAGDSWIDIKWLAANTTVRR
jgi:prepilin-type processing-associated H-X9-DG protein